MIDPDDPIIEFDPFATCDRCPARAYALSYKGSLELMWCRHHAIKYMRELDADGWTMAFNSESMQDLIQTGTPVPV